jgi:hypothetical protein
MEGKLSNGAPQFATAEYSAQPGAAVCKSCGKSITGAYYQVNGVPVCGTCAQRIKDQMPVDSHSAFVRGICFGVGGAILGLTLYVGFALATGWIVGFVSLAVGFIVGKAIAFGSGSVGGRRYQVAAVLLTYMAVSLSAVPIAISQQMRQKSAQQQAQASDPATAAAQPKMHPLKALGVLTVIGLASPFLDLANPAHGLIGLIILFVGIRIAWRLTAGRAVNIVGPINDPAPAMPG